MIKKRLPWILLAALVIIQFFQIEKTNPSTDANLDFLNVTNASAEIVTLFKGACYDCHSHETEFPSYTSFQPLGWWVRSHIRGGRMNVNLSEWAPIEESTKRHNIEEMIEVIGNKRMPLKSYGWMHDGGKLTDENRAAMINWLRTL